MTLQRGREESAADRDTKSGLSLPGTSPPQLSPPGLWPHHAPHSFVPGVSTPEGQCNPAPVHTARPGHRSVSLGVWCLMGNHKSFVLFSSLEEIRTSWKVLARTLCFFFYPNSYVLWGRGELQSQKVTLLSQSLSPLEHSKHQKLHPAPGRCSENLPALPYLLPGP